MSTFFQTKEDAARSRNWVVVDAKGQVVGRLASKIASILRGKTKGTFTPHNDCGDFVVVVNADKVEFTGRKSENKIYHKHTGYIGSVKSISAGELLASKPERVIRQAVQGMLPKNPLGRAQLSKLKVYCGSEHPHDGQIKGQSNGQLKGSAE